ncbi:MAG TPA: heme-binding protein [Candidatus Methylomirabilis sp.]|nr:heme-binding protein [Candidatus Methylomirabilis sp.]
MTEKLMLGQKPVLSLDLAKKIAEAAEAEAKKNSWPVVIAVVDDGGHLLCLHRLDEAQHGSVQIAIEKAKAAMAFKRPTKSWEEALAGGRQGVLGLTGVVPAEGGVPIAYQGKIIGAIGVSGVKPSEDGQIAKTGAAVLG